MNRRQKIVQGQFLDNEEAVIKRLEQVYSQSLKDVTKKAQKLYDEIETLTAELDFIEDEAEREIQKSKIRSKVYQKQYQDGLKKQLDDVLDKMHKENFKNVSDYLQTCYDDGFVGTLYDLQGQGIPFAFPIDQEAVTRAVQLDSKISKGLYEHLGEDVSLLKKHITAQVSRGISSGMTFNQIAQQLSFKMVGTYNNSGGSLAYAKRIARTEGHRIQCQAGMDACHKAKDMGADVVKQWDSTLDAKTRESHVKVDGEYKELDEKFSNGLMFPGDPSGRAAEVINCRCALLERARWAVKGGFTKMNNFTKQLESFESPEEYSEFKKSFFSKENRNYMRYTEQMQEKYGTKDLQKLLEKMDEREYNHFIKLQEGNPLFNKKAKSPTPLTKTGKSDKMSTDEGQRKAFTKIKVEDIPSMDEKRFNTMKKNLEKHGVSVIQDADGDAYLKGMSAEAITLSDGSAVIFQSGRIPSASAMFEETIHVSQIRKKGMIKEAGNTEGIVEYLSREIEANEKLLQNKKAYGLTQKDVESVQENLNGYYKALKEVKK